MTTPCGERIENKYCKGMQGDTCKNLILAQEFAWKWNPATKKIDQPFFNDSEKLEPKKRKDPEISSVYPCSQGGE